MEVGGGGDAVEQATKSIIEALILIPIVNKGIFSLTPPSFSHAFNPFS